MQIDNKFNVYFNICLVYIYRMTASIQKVVIELTDANTYTWKQTY